MREPLEPLELEPLVLCMPTTSTRAASAPSAAATSTRTRSAKGSAPKSSWEKEKASSSVIETAVTSSTRAPRSRRSRAS
jgi:hypothetical protein